MAVTAVKCHKGESVCISIGSTGCSGRMPGGELSGSDLGPPSQDLAGGESGARDDQPSGDRLRPHAVLARDRDQAAVQLAASLTDAIAQYLLFAERRVLNQADKIRASMLVDLERQRASVESLIGLFAERLRQQEDLSSLQESIAIPNERLDRHADAIRSLSEVQSHHTALLGQVREVLKRLEATAGGPPTVPTRP
jgi:hypothetical protein